MTLHRISARGISATFDTEAGQMAQFAVTRAGRTINPFARVPWADGPQDPARFPDGMAPHLRRMSGDFFCAPFVTDDIEGAPPHGWPANAPWTLIDHTAFPGGMLARFRLTRPVAGATLDKLWMLRDDHPFLYQRHVFTGGTRPVPVAHHAMVDLRRGGRLAFSSRMHAETPGTPPEPDGRSLLRYPALSVDLTAMPRADGSLADLTRYPFGARHEDFAMLVDVPGAEIGWASVLRPADGDVALLVKPAALLPQTMLWFSNGGRDYAPWWGEHVGVLGIEDACSYAAYGWRASISENPLTRAGIPTALDITDPARATVSVAIGALPFAGEVPPTLDVQAENIGMSAGSCPFDRAFLLGGSLPA